MKIYFNKNVSYLRNLSNLNQEELANTLGLKKAVITSYEIGRSFPRFEGLLKIQQHFGVSLDDLVYKDLSKSQVVQEDQAVYKNDSLAKRVEELESWKEQIDNILDQLFEPDQFDKILSLFTKEFDMTLPELREFFNAEVEKRLKEKE